MAETAIHWASGSWGQGQYDKPKYDDLTMAELWSEIAHIANENSRAHMNFHLGACKAKKITRSGA
jgi:hypothetical protein